MIYSVSSLPIFISSQMPLSIRTDNSKIPKIMLHMYIYLFIAGTYVSEMPCYTNGTSENVGEASSDSILETHRLKITFRNKKSDLSSNAIIQNY